MSSPDKKGWRALPKLSFSRNAPPSKAAQSKVDVAYNVRSAITLGAEWDNRKLSLRGDDKPE